MSSTLTTISRYVDDTLVLIKLTDLSQVQQFQNNFDKILRFAVHNLSNKRPYFLDTKVSPLGLTMYPNNAYMIMIGQYVCFLATLRGTIKPAYNTYIAQMFFLKKFAT